MKNIKLELNGLVLLNKPTGITSNQALQRVKRHLNAKKAGHTGALDPLATGMLPICLGEGTKFSQFLLDADKTYVVTAKLGEQTTTSDSEGEVVNTALVPSFTKKQIEAVLDHYRGDIEQIPSMYSALKYQGKPLYSYARQGIEVPREARPISIYELTLREQTVDTLTLFVRCSKGTYVRTLVDNIGEELGCHAHVIALHRESVANFDPSEMVDMESVSEKNILPLQTMLQHLPIVVVPDSMVPFLKRGESIFLSKLPAGEFYQLVTPADAFLGVGIQNDEGKLQPKRLIAC